MQIYIFLFVFTLVASSFVASTRTYEGHVVLAVQVDDANVKEFLKITKEYQLDMWKEPRVRGGESHVMVTPTDLDDVIITLREHSFSWRVHVSDIQRLVDEEKRRIQEHRLGKTPENRAYDYSSFNPFEEFLPELQALAADCPAGFQCDVYSIGQTFEGNDLNVLHISRPDQPDRSAYWLEAMMHSREWLAGSTHMNITSRLIRGYGTDPEATLLLDGYDWYLLPVVNADGYIYTWTDERLWRKNRTPNDGSECLGTDLNRNYPYKWGEVGSDDNPCSNLYRGAGPASEPVSQILIDQMTSLNSSLLAWVTLHTYGQLWLTSWAYTENSPEPGGECAEPEDYDQLLEVAEAAAGAASDSSGDTWIAGSWCETLYESSGVTQDHAKAVGNIKYAFTPELRGDNFIVDESEIPISSEEVWEALVAMVINIEAQK